MVKYLFMDCVDDVLIAPAFSFTKVELDIVIEKKTSWGKYFSTNYTWLQQNSNTGNDQWDTNNISGVLKDGVLQTNLTPFAPLNERHKYTIEFLATRTHASYVFANMSSTTAQTGGKIYGIKYYNGTILVAHYDMNTGTVQDQSGNGNHATLTGGTWMDDGTGGTDTGTDGSSIFDMKQVIYQDASLVTDTKQTIYQDSSFLTDLKQVIYQDSSLWFDSLQRLYEDASVLNDTRQVMYSDGIITLDTNQILYQDTYSTFDMLQTFYEEGQIESVSFDMRQVLYENSLTAYKMKQILYQNSFLRFPFLITREYLTIIDLDIEATRGVDLVFTTETQTEIDFNMTSQLDLTFKM